MSLENFDLNEIEMLPAEEGVIKNWKANRAKDFDTLSTEYMAYISTCTIEKDGFEPVSDPKHVKEVAKNNAEAEPAVTQTVKKMSGIPVLLQHDTEKQVPDSLTFFIKTKKGTIRMNSVGRTTMVNQLTKNMGKAERAAKKQAKAEAKAAKQAEKEGASEGLLDMLDDMDVATELFGLGKHEKAAKAEAQTKEQKDLIDELIKATANQYGGLLKNEEGLPGKKIPEGKWMRRAGQPVYVVSNEDGTPKTIYMVFDAGHGPEYDDINVANVTKEWVRMRTKQLKAEAKANKQAEKAAKKAAKNGDVEGATEALISMIELYTDMDFSDED